MQLADIVRDDFQIALTKFKGLPLKASLSWKLVPLLKAIKEQVEEYEKIRLELCERHAKKSEEGESIFITLDNGNRQFVFEQDNAALFNAELKSLLESGVELPPPSIKISDVLDFPLSYDDLMLLVGPVLLGGD